MSSPDTLSAAPGPMRWLLGPFQRFFRNEASSGILLIVCTAAALAWANSPWAASYVALWRTPFTIGIGTLALSKPLILWINDGLMAVFFFVVGLEIKREVLVGELASLRKAALPIVAAAGGMIVPALFYAAFNAGGPGEAGWGIPMATDIAFALGILLLLGPRVPLALKVFLTAVAIVDDIGAVLVIAVFYSHGLSIEALILAAVVLVALGLGNVLRVRHPLFYAAFGLVLWFLVLKSGIHATIAGVLLAMTIPARTRLDAAVFLETARRYLDEFAVASRNGLRILTNQDQQSAVTGLEDVCEGVQTPLQRLEHGLHPWVAFLIMPVFAFANAGVTLRGDVGAAFLDPVAIGVIAGLALGKQIGVTLFSWIAIRTGLAAMPEGVSWGHLYGAGLLAGIGFTMSLFIANLAFGESPLLDIAKIGILTASILSAAAGWIVLARMGSRAHT